MSVSVAAPKAPENVKATLVGNNGIKVKCDKPKDFQFYGSAHKVKAYLVKGGSRIEDEKKEKENCDFEFEDLDYLTSYTVEVCITPC